MNAPRPHDAAIVYLGKVSEDFLRTLPDSARIPTKEKIQEAINYLQNRLWDAEDAELKAKAASLGASAGEIAKALSDEAMPLPAE